MKKIISIVGTTGIGKTALAIALAKHLQTEIISCDSRQFFREMPIGTAAPTPQELSEVPHHFIGHLSVNQEYSIGQYERDALKKINSLFHQHDNLVLVGGSMMYENAVIHGLHDLPPADHNNQAQLRRLLEEEGIEPLQKLLLELDPEYYLKVDSANPRRLLRAIDIIWQTGKTYTENIAPVRGQRNFDVIRIGLRAPREIIYDRINRRVDMMLENGLLAEVEALLPFRERTALQTVGYNEMFRYLDKEWTLDFAVEEMKKNSRRFAKRQLTWYRKEHDIHWVNYENSVQESLSLVQSLNI